MAYSKQKNLFDKDFDFWIKNFETNHHTKAKNMNPSQFKRSADESQQGRIKKQRVDVEGNPFQDDFLL